MTDPSTAEKSTIIEGLTKQQSALPADQCSCESNPTQKKVLMVDDERLVLRIGCKILQQLGVVSTGVLTGSEGIELATNANERVDLLLLDIMLADMTGFDVYDQIRKKRPDLPIIFISGYCSQETLTETLKQDVLTSFLPKPFSINELAKAMTVV